MFGVVFGLFEFGLPGWTAGLMVLFDCWLVVCGWLLSFAGLYNMLSGSVAFACWVLLLYWF